MRLDSARDFGLFVKDQRQEAGFSQAMLAARAAVSRRWLADLESGKSTVEVGLVLRVIAALGLYLEARVEPVPELDLDDYLDNLGPAS